MYIDLIRRYIKESNFLNPEPQPPATEQEVQTAEGRLNVRFPDELRAFLCETNGDTYLCLSVQEIVSTNLEHRKAFGEDCDVEKFLLIATNGCGDYYGYRIDNGKITSTTIYIWEHEEFVSHKVALDLANLIDRYYQNEV